MMPKTACFKTSQTHQFNAIRHPPPLGNLNFLLRRWMFPFKKDNLCSKFGSLRHVLFGLRTLPALKNSRSTAAKLGIPVLYFVKSATHWLLCLARKCDFFTVVFNNYKHFIFYRKITFVSAIIAMIIFPKDLDIMLLSCLLASNLCILYLCQVISKA